MSEPTASIIIRCYNEREHIGKLLYGISQQDREDFEIILVDSGSTDGTLQIAKQFSCDEVVYIEPEEFSFGRALNYGCEAANGEFCVFASAHTYPKRRDWLTKLLERFDDNVALVYGKQRGNEITKYPEKRIFKRWFPEESRNNQKTSFVNNANAAIRREVWEEFTYDEELTGLEGIEWAKRVRQAQYDIAYAADATIIHVHDESPSEILNRYQREAIALSQIFSDRSFSFFDFLKAFAYNTTADYAAAAKDKELWGATLEIPVFRFLQFYGTYRGFKASNHRDEELFHRLYYPDVEGYPNNERSNTERSDEMKELPDSKEDLDIEYSDGHLEFPSVDKSG